MWLAVQRCGEVAAVEKMVGLEGHFSSPRNLLLHLQLATMSRDAYRGPKLPKFLLDQVQNGNGSESKRQNISRKDRRKQEREQKRSQRQQPRRAPQSRPAKYDTDSGDGDDADGLDGDAAPAKPAPAPRSSDAKPPKSILKKAKPQVYESESEAEVKVPVMSRVVKERLDDDDAEIAALEKKLGIKGNKSKALEQDGLDWIAGGSDGSEDDEARGLKRKRPEDTKWLRDKRLKASTVEEDNTEDAESEDEIQNPFSDDEVDSDDFEGFESGDNVKIKNSTVSARKQRENPYVPPVTHDAAPTAKYVPPSLRAPASSDEEVLKQLRRQVQGLLNRLSESNMVSILQSLEDLYSKNARQHITLTVVDLLVGLVADPSVLNDSFLILHAGFTAAVYKVAGTDFGAQVLEQLVEKFDAFWSSNAQEGKQALNMLAFLCNLYTFQVVGSAIIFDYIRLLLDELSENNTELLLRVIRTCGQSLRQYDPSALKDIILLLQRSIAKIGEANVSVRTKFMIETIQDLKNNRMKAATSSTLSTEQTNRIKKALSSLNHTRSIRSGEPLQITLADIRDSDKKGKWWLVGASYHDPSKLANNTTSANGKKSDLDEDAGYESETPGKPNLRKLAREHGMNTEVRRAIFVALLSSVDCHDAHMRLLKLHLKNKQMLEIPRVLVHCAGAENTYNPFYALVARKFCGEHHKRKAFEFAVWDFFRQMSGLNDGEEEVNVTKIVNLAKFYATLVADGSLNLRILKKLEYPYVGTKAGMFVEVFLTTIFTQSRKAHKGEAAFEKNIQGVYMPAAGNTDMIQGIREVVEAHVSKAELANGKKEKRAVEMGCRVALETLDAASKAVPVAENDDDEDDDEP